jgi:hypothetical protein
MLPSSTRRSPQLGSSASSNGHRRSRRGRPAVESIESRKLLSVSTALWTSPYLDPGTSWTIQDTVSGSTTTFYYKNAGLATAPSGQSSFEVDVTSTAGAGLFKGYYGTDSAGDFVNYAGDTTVSTGNSSDDVYNPYEVNLPGTLTAGQTVTTAAQDVNTSTNSAGVSTDTSTDNEQFTLASETPSQITVPKGTFSCYEVTEVDTTVDSSGNTSTPDTEQEWFSPGVGLVKSVDQTDGSTVVLTQFVGVDHLGVKLAPSATEFNQAINPSVQVALQDINGATDTNSSHAVTITAALSPASTGTGTLDGTLSESTVDGVATFDNLKISKPGQYVLTFTDSAGRTVSTDSFAVYAGTPRFRKFPKSGVAGNELDPKVEVELVDAKGNLVTDYPSPVTLDVGGADAGNPVEGNTAEMVNGIAVFSHLRFPKTGTYVLSASDTQADKPSTPTELKISGYHLVFQTEPGKAGVGDRLNYVVELLDASDKIVYDNRDGVELTLNTVKGGQDARLSSRGDILVYGKASNSSSPYISINSPGTYTLTARELPGAGVSESEVSATEPAKSVEFSISADHLVFAEQPRKGKVGIALKYLVELKDFENNLVKSFDHLSIRLVRVEGGKLAVITPGADILNKGEASNTASVPNTITAPGTYRLVISDEPAVGNPAAASVMSDEFKITG